MLTRPCRWWLALGPGVLLAALPLALHASADGVEPARTGGFGEPTCQQCHWENPLNDPAGRIAVTGVPEAYTPGEQYLITVTLARPDLRRAGFQMSAREDGINMSAGSNAGTLQPVDESAADVQGGPRHITYVQHTAAGTNVTTPGTAAWRARWTAPESPGIAVVFHVAANAANDDSSPLGDFVYTTTATSH